MTDGYPTPDPFKILQSTRGTRYVEAARRQYHFDEDNRRATALSFDDWRGSPERTAVEISENDQEAIAQLISFMSRPTRPDLSLKHMQAFGNEVIRVSVGKPHPRFEGRPRKKRSEIISPFKTLDRFLRRAFKAGQAFEYAWSECGSPHEFGRVFADSAGVVFGLDRIAPESEDRRKLYSEYISVIHLAMVLRATLIGNGFDIDGDGLLDGSLTDGILRFKQPPDWMGRLLIAIEEYSYRIYFQQIIPHPERLIRFRMRDRDFLL